MRGASRRCHSLTKRHARPPSHQSSSSQHHPAQSNQPASSSRPANLFQFPHSTVPPIPTSTTAIRPARPSISPHPSRYACTFLLSPFSFFFHPHIHSVCLPLLFPSPFRPACLPLLFPSNRPPHLRVPVQILAEDPQKWPKMRVPVQLLDRDPHHRFPFPCLRSCCRTVPCRARSVPIQLPRRFLI